MDTLNNAISEYQTQGVQIEVEGYKAGCARKLASDNPYRSGQWQHVVWEEGRTRAVVCRQREDSLLTLWNE